MTGWRSKVPRKICILTGSRADYSHLSPVIDAINLHPELLMQLIVTGQHVDKKYGSTWKNIKNDGYKITKKIDNKKVEFS